MPCKYATEYAENNVDFIPQFVEGKFDIPMIWPEEYEEMKWFPYGNPNANYKRFEHGVHFFVYDYRFQAMWNHREKYAGMLKEFKAVMAPDFSLYYDWPVMVQMWNHYRKHLLAAWMQSIGIKVYPVIRWTDEKSWDWCFDGEPWRSTVVISSKGTYKNVDDRRVFMKGYDRMLEVLEPETIMFYGKIPEHCRGNIIPVDEFTRRFKELT